MSKSNQETGRHQEYDPMVLRALDANLNRASEAIRVLEDCFRFVLNDAFLSRKAKWLRHELSATAQILDVEAISRARDSSGDVGRTTKTAAEYERTGIDAVLTANFKRAQQSLRSLEEFSKTVDPTVAGRFEALRYDIYALQHSANATCWGCQHLGSVHLYALVGGCASGAEFASLVDALLDGGVDAIQIRDKQLNDRELLDRARTLVSQVRGRGVLTFINDRSDLAAISGADGVHLGQEDVPVSQARSILKPHQLIGVSTHSLEQAQMAVSDGANYIGVGPVFQSRTKQFESLPGIDLLAKVAREVSLPAFAIGGIAPDNVHQVTAAGIKRIAVHQCLTANLSETAVVARQLQVALGVPFEEVMGEPVSTQQARS